MKTVGKILYQLLCLVLTLTSCHFDKRCTRRDEHHELPKEVWEWATFKEGEMLVFENEFGITDTCFYGPWVQSEYFKYCTTEGKDCCVRHYQQTLTNSISRSKKGLLPRWQIEFFSNCSCKNLVVSQVSAQGVSRGQSGITSDFSISPDSLSPDGKWNDCINVDNISYSKSKGIVYCADNGIWKRIK